MASGSMRVVEISQPGGPESLNESRRDIPSPGYRQILIRNMAAGVNRPDALQRAGLYLPPPGASDLPGLESAGEVCALGAEVTRWKIGDQVTALLPGGGYAEYSLTHEDHALAVPSGLNMVSAAALCETHFTVWSNVFLRGQLKAGEAFLVHGGSSGIGTTAIQLASRLGADVFATAGNDEKCRKCEELGAKLCVNYRTADFVESIRSATGGQGVDVILDMVGGSYMARNLKCLADEGRLVQIAFLSGPRAELNFAPLMTRRLTMTGSTLRPQSDLAKADIADDLRQRVWPLLESGKIAPIIDSTFPLAEAAQAHAHMESSVHIGKIILTIRDRDIRNIEGL
ncbi:MAG: NAD(P)H-quinone oxidoreductase [Rhodobacteraceae bacterium]|nr:NAD(P)H-quinone oxidoreductase [Paracoccaceae bacterium]